MGIINRFSRVLSLQLSSNIKGTFVSKSQKLFTDTGLTHFKDGVPILMPFLFKSLRKLERIVHKEMREIGALECRLPILTDSKLLEKSGRLNLPDLFRVNYKANYNFVLSPTCEEAVTHLMTLYQPLVYRSLPIRLYQIANKFRDEKRSKSGLLRSKEFIMKDLYCFDTSEETCEQCYQEVINQYHHFFEVLQVPHVCVEANTGDIGGLNSHEFLFLSDAGEDKLASCKNCGHIKKLLYVHDKDKVSCEKCQSSNVTVDNVIEVGHAFKLGTRFTKPFNAVYVNEKMEKDFLQMSCFGLGLTRILAATVEVLCRDEEIRWPITIAPYLVCVVLPKAGSKEEAAAGDIPNHIYHSLNQLLEDDVIIDDRTSSTIGRRLHFSKKLGIPLQVIIGKSICEDPPKVEVLDCITGSTDLVQTADVNQFVSAKLADILNTQKQGEKISVQF